MSFPLPAKLTRLPRRDGGVYRAAVGVLRELPVVTRSIRAAAIALERGLGLYASRELVALNVPLVGVPVGI